MTTLVPRAAYTEEELKKLYPDNLELYLVQVLLRHGERTPVSARFQNAGVYPNWPYCSAAERFRAALLTTPEEGKWTEIQWKRRLETFGDDDHPVTVRGRSAQSQGICQLGELTDKGRETTHDLGTRLRRLYVDQLHFMPATLDSSDSLYLRATPITRALESLQQTFIGMYPPSTLSKDFTPPSMVTRTHADETLYPNEGSCQRFRQLARAFGQRAADRWNESPEMDHLNRRIGKWMPESSPKVAVDSHPRLSGILDSTNSTFAHGPETRLPKEFYETRTREIVDKIVTEEWFAGYLENVEYRTLGIGALAGDIVERMTTAAESSANHAAPDSENNRLKFALSGCHDTTVGALVAGFGAFKGRSWPPYTSNLAIELFREKPPTEAEPANTSAPATPHQSKRLPPTSQPGWFASMLTLFTSSSTTNADINTIARKPYSSLSESQKQSLDNFYVRVRYNDEPLTLPTCQQPGNHLKGDPTFCTLTAFKRIVDGFTPQNWKQQCKSNLDAGIIGVNIHDIQPAGLIEPGK